MATTHPVSPRPSKALPTIGPHNPWRESNGKARSGNRSPGLMWRGLETGFTASPKRHEAGNAGHSQGGLRSTAPVLDPTNRTEVLRTAMSFRKDRRLACEVVLLGKVLPVPFLASSAVRRSGDTRAPRSPGSTRHYWVPWMQRRTFRGASLKSTAIFRVGQPLGSHRTVIRHTLSLLHPNFLTLSRRRSGPYFTAT